VKSKKFILFYIILLIFSITANTEQITFSADSMTGKAGVGKRRTRRINLNTAFAEDEPQTEEDRIAADMMSANGNTVDFTA